MLPLSVSNAVVGFLLRTGRWDVVFFGFLVNDPTFYDLLDFWLLLLKLLCFSDAPHISTVNYDFGNSNGSAAAHAQPQTFSNGPVTGCDPYEDAAGNDGDEDVYYEYYLAMYFLEADVVVFGVVRAYGELGCREALGKSLDRRRRVDHALVSLGFFLSTEAGHQSLEFGGLVLLGK